MLTPPHSAVAAAVAALQQQQQQEQRRQRDLSPPATQAVVSMGAASAFKSSSEAGTPAARQSLAGMLAAEGLLAPQQLSDMLDRARQARSGRANLS